MAVILLNLFFEKGNACLVFRTGEGRKVVSEEYRPHFFALCDNAEEKAWLFSQHPLVLDAKEECGAVKVTTLIKDFRQVISDVRNITGVAELAETSVPHYFRYVNEKKLVFFQDYDDSLRPVGGQDEMHALSKLRLGVVAPDKDAGEGYSIVDERGEKIASPAGRAHLAKNERVGLADADIVFSNGGDEFLKNKKGVITTPAGCLFREAVHIDVKTDMEHDIYDESSTKNIFDLGRERLIRIMELSYMTGTKPDMVSRVTAGKLNVFLHMAAAKRRGRLIPDTKKSVERPKTLRTLRMMDKGGTIFYPRPGIYENVAKCDFASMYPNIIVKYNISAETMHCDCGEYHEVPGIGWKICKKPGLIPQGLGAVLERRLELKRLMREEANPAKRQAYNLRQRALKNILVTSFGYLGFKNFIFSNVECKECVVHYGRHILERTKRLAEEEGLEVVYGMVDSVFVKGGTEAGYRRFAEKVSGEFGFELEIDCIFRKVAFPSGNDGGGAANKYYGITAGGKIEARGIAIRHSDSPDFIGEFQERAIRAFLGEGGVAGLGSLADEYERAILDGKIPPEKLAITKSVRREAYAHALAHVKAYNLAGKKGRSVTFIYTLDGPKPLDMADGEIPDHNAYLHLLGQAKEELVMGLGKPL
ncbi:MAG: DNA polymerase domain-containing protein [Candidatus Micrarchaeota archaeon]